MAILRFVQRAAVAMDAGDVEGLTALLHVHPELATARLTEVGVPAHAYCVGPTLLHLVANNPNRTPTMPPRILESAQVLLAAGAVVDAPTLDPGGATPLALVASSGPARCDGMQVPLIELLVAHGADPARALPAAIHERCPEAAAALVRLGAPATLLSAAGMGDEPTLMRRLAAASPSELMEAAATAVAHGHAAFLVRLLDAGIALNAPIPRHPYQPTLLHQAGSFGQLEVARLLLDRGADPTRRDSRFNGTPAEWAREGGHATIAEMIDGAIRPLST